MPNKTIVTHSGSFHADDVFSVAALKSVYSSFDLIRTRDPKKIATADIVVDVGNEYDPQTGRFDHHQRGGAGQRDNGIPYSSFGLIWRQYGLRICEGNQVLADAVDAQLVAEIDAIDCGYVEGVTQGISLSHTIGMFNPSWQEQSDFDSSFNEAVSFAERILARFIADAKGALDATDIVTEAIDQAVDPRLIVLSQYTPWKETVLSLSPRALFVVYPSHSQQWLIQAVPVQLNTFEDRKSLPAHWAGLSDAELQQVTGIEDAMFCHNGLFIGGAQTYQGILKMAALALAND